MLRMTKTTRAASVLLLTTSPLVCDCAWADPAKKKKADSGEVSSKPGHRPVVSEADPAASESVATKLGHVLIVSDADALVAEVAGALHGLKTGENRIQVPAGATKIVVRSKKDAEVATFQVNVPAAGEARVTVVTKGTIVVDAGEQQAVEVDGNAVTAKDGRMESSVAAGKHSVVVSAPGRIGQKGDIEVVAGKTHTISPQLRQLEIGNKSLAWAGIYGGGAMVLVSVLMESFVDAGAAGGDVTRWGLAGVGAAAFVLGTIEMKDILKKESTPPVDDTTFKVKISSARQFRGAGVSMRF